MFLGALMGFSLMSGSALAQYTSESANNPVIVVDKKIRPINSEKFWDNLSSEQKTFGEGDQIEFLINVSNKGNSNLTNIKVVDYLPKFLTLMFFPGTKNLSENKVETTIDNLNPGESKEFTIRARISDVPRSNYANVLRQMSNRACATNNLASDCDTAKYFIGLSTTPATGNNDMTLYSIMGSGALILAMGMRKLARGY